MRSDDLAQQRKKTQIITAERNIDIMDTSSEYVNSRNYEEIQLLDIISSTSTYKGPYSKIREMFNKLEFDDETDENDDLTDLYL